jgi:hypothetical protein
MRQRKQAMKKLPALLSLLALLAAAPAAAHHAEAMYDASSLQNLAGTVKGFDWGNPHSWITLVVTKSDGSTADWQIECNSSALLTRFGWTPTSVKPGDHISVTIAPHFDGIQRGEAIRVTTASGQVLDNAMVEP